MVVMDRQVFAHTAQQGGLPALVFFFSPWCFYCRRILSILERIAHRYRGCLVIGQVDIDREYLLAKDEQIEVVPTLVLYHGGNVLGSLVLPENREEIEALLQKIFP